MKAKRMNDVIETSRRIEARKVFIENSKSDFGKLKKILKDQNVAIKDKDTTVLYNPDRNTLYVCQETEMEVEASYKVTDEMKKAGIQGEYIISKYTDKDYFVIGKIKDPNSQLLEKLTFKRLPRVKVEGKQKKAA